MKTLKERIEDSRKFLEEYKARTSNSLHELQDLEDEFCDDFSEEEEEEEEEDEE